MLTLINYTKNIRITWKTKGNDLLNNYLNMKMTRQIYTQTNTAQLNEWHSQPKTVSSNWRLWKVGQADVAVVIRKAGEKNRRRKGAMRADTGEDKRVRRDAEPLLDGQLSEPD